MVSPPDNKGGSREIESSSEMMNLWDEKGQGHSTTAKVTGNAFREMITEAKERSYLISLQFGFQSNVVYLIRIGIQKI